MAKEAFIRVEGGHRVGLGHVSRMLALADAIGEAGPSPPTFVLTNSPIAQQQIVRKGYEVLSVKSEEEFLRVAETTHPALLLVDLREPEQILRLPLLERIACVAVFVDEPIVCSGIQILVNGQVTAGSPQKEVRGGVQYLRGPKYMVLGKEFSDVPVRKVSDHFTVLVTMGGSDPDGHTPEIIRELLSQENITIQAILGAAFAHDDSLNFCQGDPRVEILRDVQNMRPLMENADVAISSVGITLYELAATCTPTVIVGQDPSQEQIAHSFPKAGFGIHVGLRENLRPGQLSGIVSELLRNPKLRRTISKRGRDLVDGLGSFRVAREIVAALARREEFYG